MRDNRRKEDSVEEGFFHYHWQGAKQAICDYQMRFGLGPVPAKRHYRQVAMWLNQPIQIRSGSISGRLLTVPRLVWEHRINLRHDPFCRRYGVRNRGVDAGTLITLCELPGGKYRCGGFYHVLITTACSICHVKDGWWNVDVGHPVTFVHLIDKPNFYLYRTME